MKTRKLLPGDSEKIIDLVETRWSTVRKRRDSDHNEKLIVRFLAAAENSGHEFGQLGEIYAYGAFNDDDQLVSAVTQRFWSSHDMHYISNMVVRPNTSMLYNVAEMGLASCIDQAIHFAEKIQFFRWIWITETRGWHHREEQWYNNCAAYRRYHVYIEDIIPKGQLPKFDWQIDMIGHDGAGATTAIKSASLKPEFRHRYFQSKKLIKGDFIDLQYRPLESKDLYINDITWSGDLVITETNLEFYKEHSAMLLAEHLIVDPISYPDHIRHGEHRYFRAMKDNKLAGMSAMVLHKTEDGSAYRIYHRGSYTVPEFRRQGVWNALMRHKIKYMLDNGWNKTFPIHSVSASDTDTRYSGDGWTVYKSGLRQEHTNPDGSVTVINRLIYVTNWSNIKKQYLNHDV